VIVVIEQELLVKQNAASSVTPKSFPIRAGMRFLFVNSGPVL
jgi:hypothetical protein